MVIEPREPRPACSRCDTPGWVKDRREIDLVETDEAMTATSSRETVDELKDIPRAHNPKVSQRRATRSASSTVRSILIKVSISLPGGPHLPGGVSLPRFAESSPKDLPATRHNYESGDPLWASNSGAAAPF